MQLFVQNVYTLYYKPSHCKFPVYVFGFYQVSVDCYTRFLQVIIHICYTLRQLVSLHSIFIIYVSFQQKTRLNSSQCASQHHRNNFLKTLLTDWIEATIYTPFHKFQNIVQQHLNSYREEIHNIKTILLLCSFSAPSWELVYTAPYTCFNHALAIGKFTFKQIFNKKKTRKGVGKGERTANFLTPTWK